MKVGIDLGTTNSAIAYIDPVEAAESDFPPIHTAPIEQQVTANQSAALRTLPSFIYLSDPPVVGAWAREQGALLPTKTIHSAKSWLSNSEADRTAKLLPWDSEESGRVMSPVEASTKYLAYLAECWEKVKGTPLAEQDLVLTVPASFDEEARELTVEAARTAGLERLSLLEEPAAAFYAWISSHLARSNKDLFDGQMVLVCDVGGGTTDFTLIRVSREGDRVEFTRTTVGKHLLLGGDNLDLTLSWLVESKLDKQLSLRQRSGLRRQCSSAKERMLSEGGPQGVEITVAGAGSSLVGGTLKTSLTRSEALELAVEGFLPACELGDRPQQEKQSVFRELGLPYVSDPAITRHLAEFLSQAPEARNGIDAILFNGGFFIPDVFRSRVREVVGHWYGREPQVFENHDLDLAVAVGAAYYSFVHSTGTGVLVRGGLPRAYYLGLQDERRDAVRAVCLVPRGTEDGSDIHVDKGNLQLMANKPVSFNLYSSLVRTDDAAGDIVELDVPSDALDPTSEPRLHAPLRAVIRFGKGGEKLIPIKLAARLSEVGTLETWAESKISDHRWRLQFQLRKTADEAVESGAVPTVRSSTVVAGELQEQALELINRVFGPGDFSIPPEQLPARLEQVLALGRLSWPLPAIRAFSDKLLALADGRKKNAAHEARWLNLTGFCLRPGFGFPGDDLRIEQVRKVYAAGLTFANQVQCQVEWQIFCGRLATGFNRNQQADIYQRIAPFLFPKQKQKQQRVNPSLWREMWRTASSLELLPLQTKSQIGEALLSMLKKGEMPESCLWCLSRLGARKLFRAPINQVLSATTVARWVETILNRAHSPALLEAVTAIAQQTGDAARDLPPVTLGLVRKAIDASADSAMLLRRLTGASDDGASRAYGEQLPEGLVAGPVE